MILRCAVALAVGMRPHLVFDETAPIIETPSGLLIPSKLSTFFSHKITPGGSPFTKFPVNCEEPQ